MSSITLVVAQGERSLMGGILDVLGVRFTAINPDALLAGARREVGSEMALIVSESQLLALYSAASGSASRLRNILARFRQVLIYPLSGRGDIARILSELVEGTVEFIHFANKRQNYTIANNRELCGPFAGLSFGPVKPQRDCGVVLQSTRHPIEQLVSIGDTALFMKVKVGDTELFLLSCNEVFDAGIELRKNLRASECFSELVPLLLFILNCANLPRWRANISFANIIIDDPKLESRYGFVRFRSLTRLINDLGCAVSVGFIPWNFRRNSQSIIDLFRSNSPRLSICIHGCDHTAAEFSTRSVEEAFSLLRLGEKRMRHLAGATGLGYDKIMVFPQGIFSGSAMRALRQSQLFAAVNTELLDRQAGRGVPARELLRLAITSYSGFPLFLRRKPDEPLENFALDLLLGKPCLVVTHHDFFRDKYAAFQSLVASLNKLQDGLCWTNLERIVSESYCTRRAGTALCEVNVFSTTTRFSTELNGSEAIQIRKCETLAGQFDVALNGSRLSYSSDGSGLLAEPSRIKKNDTLTIACAPCEQVSSVAQSLKYRLKVAVRRHLCEIRDNYVTPARFALHSLAP
jgi:hypothetical protein